MTDERLTVGQLSERYGVTVRTLHHYDAIGLVVPSERAWNGYRLYTPSDVQRLARVVALRRLEIPLAEIEQVQDDARALGNVLTRRREAVMERLEELNGVLQAIDTAMKSEATMTNQVSAQEMKAIFGDRFDESYATEAQERWGETEMWKESQHRQQNYTKADWVQIKAEGDAVMDAFATAKRADVSPEDAQDAVREHVAHIEKWFYPVDTQTLAGLGQMYVADSRFAQTYEDVEPGLAAYVSAAIAAYCAQ